MARRIAVSACSCCVYNKSLLGLLALADPELQFRGHMASAEREPIIGSRGGAPSGVQGQVWYGIVEFNVPEPLVRGSGGEAPEAESILALGRPTDTANLHPWPVAVFSV